MAGMDALQKLLSFMKRLDASKIHYSLDRVREEAVMVRVDVPGERWEVEFFVNGQIEVEVFSSGGPHNGIEGEESLDRLFETFTD
jgi:hypothetical protein